ncbi:aldolase [Cohnella sp. 56]|uniref:aldolase n=1 Tax=Cohnella sp. 56 TaxID=3113722 RepID=UPI0030E77BC4
MLAKAIIPISPGEKMPTTRFHRYFAFGLNIKSEITLPELMPGQASSIPDIEISYGDLGQAWESSETQASFFRLTADGVMFAVPRMAIYQIKNGHSITIHPLEDADEKWIRLYLLGSCMGTLLMQRGVLPLHGSAVVIDGGAYCFLGESGAGKSTLAALFTGRGYELLTDDVIPVAFDIDEQGRTMAFVTPSYPQQKLWQESLDRLGMDAADLRRLLPEMSKYAVPTSASYCKSRVPLRGIFELLPSEAVSSVELEKVVKLSRLSLIGQHTYRNFLISLLGLEEWHFRSSAQLAGLACVHRILRPLAPFSAMDIADRILETILSEGTTDVAKKVEIVHANVNGTKTVTGRSVSAVRVGPLT